MYIYIYIYTWYTYKSFKDRDHMKLSLFGSALLLTFVYCIWLMICNTVFGETLDNANLFWWTLSSPILAVQFSHDLAKICQVRFLFCSSNTLAIFIVTASQWMIDILTWSQIRGILWYYFKNTSAICIANLWSFPQRNQLNTVARGALSHPSADCPWSSREEGLRWRLLARRHGRIKCCGDV